MWLFLIKLQKVVKSHLLSETAESAMLTGPAPCFEQKVLNIEVSHLGGLSRKMTPRGDDSSPRLELLIKHCSWRLASSKLLKLA